MQFQTIFAKTATTTSATSIWVTTTVGGKAETVEVEYSQSFPSFYTKVATVPKGSIGLGTISGKVGTIRTYSTFTTS